MRSELENVSYLFKTPRLGARSNENACLQIGRVFFGEEEGGEQTEGC